MSILAFYFAFTSFTTTGFGDYYPVSDSERLFCALFLIIGVSIQSYIMNTFIGIL